MASATSMLTNRAEAEPASASLTMSANGTYDSNIFRSSASERGGVEAADLVTLPEANLAITVPFGRQAFEGRVHAGYSFHDRYSFLDSSDLGALGRLRWEIAERCDGIGSAERTRRLLSFEDRGDRQRIIERGRFLSATMNCRIGANISLRGRIDDNQRHNKGGDTIGDTDFTRAVRDTDERIYEGRIRYGGIGPLEIEGLVRRQVRSQPNAPVAIDGMIGTRATIRDLGGGLSWRPSPRLAAIATLYDSRLRETTGLRNGSLLGYEGSLDYEIGPKTRFRGFIERRFAVASTISAPSFRTRAFGGSVEWKPTVRIETTLEVSRRSRRILRDIIPIEGLAFVQRERDKTAQINWSTTYAVDDHLAVVTAFGYARRSGNIADREYRVTRATIGLRLRLASPPETLSAAELR